MRSARRPEKVKFITFMFIKDSVKKRVVLIKICMLQS